MKRVKRVLIHFLISRGFHVTFPFHCCRVDSDEVFFIYLAVLDAPVLISAKFISIPRPENVAVFPQA